MLPLGACIRLLLHPSISCCGCALLDMNASSSIMPCSCEAHPSQRKSQCEGSVGTLTHSPLLCSHESCVDGKSVRVSYLLWLPRSYLLWHYGPDPGARDAGPQLPLMVYLHGAGGRELGDERMERLWQEYPNPLNLSSSGGLEFPFILMMPHCPTGAFITIPEELLILSIPSPCMNTNPTQGEEWAKGRMPEHVVDTVFQVASSHSIDPGRIYLTGKSMGGEGTWKVAATCPRLFAAIVPMCGGNPDPNPDPNSNPNPYSSQRIDSTPSFTTTQCSDCQADSRLVWVMAATDMLCVLGMLASGVDIILPH